MLAPALAMPWNGANQRACACRECLTEQPVKPAIERERLKRMCSTRPLGRGTIAKSEDPYENSFTEAVTFLGTE